MALAGCSDRQAGEIMMGISTNMSLPKDVSQLRIVISAHGERLIDLSKDLDPDLPEAAKLPGTLAVVQGEDPSMPITMRVVALQGRELKPRVVAKAISTIPTERVALLNLPIDWLCDQDVKNIGDDLEDDYDSACGEGRRCVAGACVDSSVDEAALGNYSPADVFGGGTGSGDGSCFDTQPCFEGATTADVDLDTCTFTPPSGSLNVALRTTGDGICGPSGCLVPIDQSDTGAGWVEEDGKVQLPNKMCTLIKESKALDVALSTSCATKTVANPTCGPWSSTGEGQLSHSGATVLASSQEHPVGIGVWGARLYWLTTGVATEGSPAGQLKSAPLLGGSPAQVTSETFPGARALSIGIGVDGPSDLFFTGYGAEASSTSGTRYHLANANGVGLELTSNLDTPEGIAAFASGTAQAPSWTTFTTSFVGGTVSGYAKGDASPTTFATGENYPYRIAITPNRKYAVWINEGQLGLNDGAVRYAATDDLVAKTLVDTQATPRALAVDNAGACWTTLGDSGLEGEGAIHCIGFDGSGRVDIPGQFFPSGIAIDATTIYWTNRGDGTVRRAPRTGGEPVLGAVNQYKPGAITLNEGVLYWVNEGSSSEANGSVMSLSLTSTDWGALTPPVVSGGSTSSTGGGSDGAGGGGAGGAAP